MFIGLYDVYHGLILIKDIEIDKLACCFDSLHCINYFFGYVVGNWFYRI